MKNLQLLKLSRAVRNVEYEDNIQVAYTNNFIYFLKNSGVVVYDNNGVTVLTINDFRFDDDYKSRLEVLNFNNKLWFGTGFNFICIDLADNSLQIFNDSIEFTVTSWNPTQDSFVVITINGEVRLYSCDFQCGALRLIKSSSLNDDTEVQNFVNVGWGSEATQFQGTSGKRKSKCSIEDEPMPFEDDFKPRISWNEDSELFAINYYNEGIRKVKIYKYPCELLYQTPDVIGLLPVVAWKPGSHYIVCAVWTTKRCAIEFYEENAVFKERFSLFENMYVETIQWNDTGNILAVCQKDSDRCTIIDLYNRYNYQWHLKQRLNFDISDPLISFEFIHNIDSEITLRTTTIHETTVYSLEFMTHFNYCSNDLVFGTIDGNNVYLQCSMKYAIPAFPYNCLKIVVDSPVNAILFHPTKPEIAVINCKNVLTIFKYENHNIIQKQQIHLDVSTNTIPLRYHNFIWYSNDIIACLQKNISSEVLTSLFKLDILNNCAMFEILSEEIGYLKRYKDDVMIGQITNKIVLYNWVDIPTLAILPIPATHIDFIVIDGDIYIFSLTSTNKFFVNSREEFQGVISFIIYKSFLFLTTNKSQLICIKITKDTIHSISKHIVLTRSIEQGASLLFVLPCSFSIAMQIPRGNIEMYNCPLLLYEKLESILQKQEWLEGLDFVRLQKISYQKLIDLNSDRFICNIDKFIESVKYSAIINDFLLELPINENDSEFFTNDNSYIHHNILQVICDKMIEYMKNYNYKYYSTSIIIAIYKKNSPIFIKECLQFIQSLLCEATADESAIKAAEDAIKLLYTLKPTEKLYETALSMFALDLSLFVARNTNLDPRIYEPFITKLSNLNDIERRFIILDSLKMYSKAISYYLRCYKTEKQLFSYIVEHNLYCEAYTAINSKHKLHKNITIEYANYLKSKKLYKDAAVLFNTINMKHETINIYKQGLLWREAFAVMDEIDVPHIEKYEHTIDLQKNLIKNRRILEAVELTTNHLLDYKGAIELLISNHYYVEAIKYSQKHNCGDILDIIQLTLEHCQKLENSINNLKIEFRKYKTRLSELKFKKNTEHKQHNKEIDQNLSASNEFVDRDDQLSVSAYSTSTYKSNFSTMSSRNKRKLKRRMYDLREGGVYEEIAIMKKLFDLIQEIFQFGPEVRNIFFSVFEIDSDLWIKFVTLHNTLLQLQLYMQSSIGEIWPNTDILNEDNNEDPINLHLLDIKYRVPPSNIDTNWKIEMLEKSGLNELN